MTRVINLILPVISPVEAGCGHPQGFAPGGGFWSRGCTPTFPGSSASRNPGLKKERLSSNPSRYRSAFLALEHRKPTR